jgi:tetratricopeptide (TPR) repeat protein
MSCAHPAVFGVLGLFLAVANAQGAEAPRPAITVHAYEESADPAAGAQADQIEARVGAALAGDARVAFSPALALLEPPDQATRSLGMADLDVADAEKAFAAMELDEAKKLLERAIATYQKNLPALADRKTRLKPLRDAWLKLAKTRFFDGNQEGARDALRYAFALDPAVGYSKALFPPTMKKTVVEAKLLFETLGPGKLAIDSDPPGATVLLDGVRLDKPTPTEVAEATPGPHYVTFVHRGFATVTALVENRGEGEASSAVQSLPRPERNPFGPFDRARAQLDKTEQPPHLKSAAEALGVELLILVRTDASPGGTTRRVSAYLYDARPDRVLKRIEKTAPVGEVPQAAGALVGPLLDEVRLDGVLPAAPPPPPRPPTWWARFSEHARADLVRFSTNTRTEMVRFYHWKYFWYVVGGVAGAVVVSTAVGAGVAAHNRQTADNTVVLLGGR